MVREYIRPGGYRIKASEKAYNLLYKKNGFVPAEDAVPTGETTGEEITTPVKDAVQPAEKPVKANKGKRKAAAPKPGENTTTNDISRQGETLEDATDTDAADQDAAEQPEGE